MSEQQPMSDKTLKHIRDQAEMYVEYEREDPVEGIDPCDVLDLLDLVEHYKQQAEHYHRLWSDSDLDRRVAESSVERLTSDSMAERIKEAVGDGFERVIASDGHPSIAMRDADDLSRDVLATIRAVAADEQAEGGERG